jgi:hypothetical protein
VTPLPSLVETVAAIWGDERAVRVVHEYQQAMSGREMFVRDLAMFCNAAAPIQGASEFERGCEEGKRRVWLHLSRMAGLRGEDFVKLTDGTQES